MHASQLFSAPHFAASTVAGGVVGFVGFVGFVVVVVPLLLFEDVVPLFLFAPVPVFEPVFVPDV
jgi:hypothetical protein